MELSTILVEERKKKGITQQEVADTLYITRQSLSNWENGKNFPDIPMLVELSKYYDFSLDIIKGDAQLMNQVQKDYELINTKKANKKYSVLLVILTALIVLTSVVLIPLVSNNKILLKSFTLFDLLLCIVLIHTAVKFSKIVYQYYEGIPNSPLWVPKVFGYGISINPYNKFGKIITIALLVILDLFFIGVGITMIFFG
ncbi:helix-turn-helix transcriptional regulator [Lactococcus lactis subsp. lactis]|jgi:transcriptional regulator with XRE-family HTH domain|uniref:Transcription regulator n=1 Tax=Lactococcus lactis subsp. lactis NCDO 2118 TaxID=1117941 RepID=A0ABC8A9G7_LACLL|nr:helix-turn-helix transcriptional regulator [Lactococcus lactis]ADA66090.1 DNA-binding protein, XRE family [Lactococcus lactis subsp. lactis KF147]AII13851.1 Transcription regulator [Lactococcus lactis subsp. lactis NCDO 2118]TRW58156.1 helix-turn-helix domain-containing protein [Lactococcus lactis]TRW66416.1 helix-turn-helix domain-containing protein [Lactococcus lactis]